MLVLINNRNTKKIFLKKYYNVWSQREKEKERKFERKRKVDDMEECRIQINHARFTIRSFLRGTWQDILSINTLETSAEHLNVLDHQFRDGRLLQMQSQSLAQRISLYILPRFLRQPSM